MGSFRRTTVMVAFAAALGAFALPAPGRDGLVARTALRPVAGSGFPDATGGVQAWILVRGDGSVQQRFNVWANGIIDDDVVTLWMASPGDLELEQVAEMAVYGSEARFQAGIDTNRDFNDELPLGVDRVLDLLRAPVEVRVPDTIEEDIAVLRGEVGVFRLRAISTGAGRKGVSSRKSRLRRPTAPLDAVDEEARGFVRLWADRGGRSGAGQGITLFVRGLTPETDYELHVEDGTGDLVELGDGMFSTAEGQALFVVNTRPDGDDATLPIELGVDDVRELVGRRIEVRQSGDDRYTLAGVFPRVP